MKRVKRFISSTIKKIKRINESFKKVRGKKRAQFEELMCEGIAMLDNITDNQLRLGYKAR